VRLNPVLEELASYPFVRLTEAKEAVAARGVEIVDFGIGEPREETPAFIRAALVEALEPMSTYPTAAGLPAYRDAVAAWIGRRYGVTVDPGTAVLPSLGSKEAIFHLIDVLGPGAVAVTTPGYPVPERAARFAGRRVVELPLTAERDWLPELEDLPEDLAVLWLNAPNNPTAATIPPDLYARAAALARERGFVLASDEAYSELWFSGDPPASALQVGDLSHVVVFNTLSKRSSMPGYRCGFVAGDPAIIAALKRYRPNVGVAPPSFIQRAGIAAWSDEEHVEAVRDVYRAKRDVVLPAFEAAGFEKAGGDASFFLWLRAPSDDAAGALLERGVAVAPGEVFGPAGAGYVRVALVPTLEECRRAAEVVSRWHAAPG
jgi:succinyldiaminopimelate transaminase